VITTGAAADSPWYAETAACIDVIVDSGADIPTP
jgi:hypothetical protein